MPYTKPEDRLPFADGIQALRDAFAEVGATDGDLNYVLTSVALAWLEYHQPPHGYSLRSDVIKAFECAKLEFYRRMLAPYENCAIMKSGDVYEEPPESMQKMQWNQAKGQGPEILPNLSDEGGGGS